MRSRHGLITGATGTGKTVTLQVVAERLSRIGVPTFMADVKGDLAGLAAPGRLSPKMTERLKLTGAGEPQWGASPVVFWDVLGRGTVNILAAEQLMTSPTLYSTFLLWMLSELFERLPEVGDPDKPKMVFFFDEAHLLFEDAPSALVEKIEQVVRLIRSKGIGERSCAACSGRFLEGGDDNREPGGMGGV